VTQSDLLSSPLQRRGSPYSPRFAALYALRSKLKASVNNALLDCTILLPDSWQVLHLKAGDALNIG
jgi:hypothetical protein